MNDEETWLPIPSCPGYDASNLGRIRSWRWGINRRHRELATEPRIKSVRVNGNGYVMVGTGHTKSARVHVLVADAFIGPKPDRMDVNHIDGNKQNNRADNLEYVTRSENHRHAFKLGLAKSPFTGMVGEKHFRAKLSDRDVIAIRESYANGVPRRDLAAQYSLSYYTVWDITSRRSWTHV